MFCRGEIEQLIRTSARVLGDYRIILRATVGEIIADSSYLVLGVVLASDIRVIKGESKGIFIASGSSILIWLDAQTQFSTTIF